MGVEWGGKGRRAGDRRREHAARMAALAHATRGERRRPRWVRWLESFWGVPS